MQKQVTNAGDNSAQNFNFKNVFENYPCFFLFLPKYGTLPGVLVGFCSHHPSGCHLLTCRAFLGSHPTVLRV